MPVYLLTVRCPQCGGILERYCHCSVCNTELIRCDRCNEFYIVLPVVPVPEGHECSIVEDIS